MRVLMPIVFFAVGLSLLLLVVAGKPSLVNDSSRFSSNNIITDIDAYEDVDYGFSVAIPTGWTRIVAAETNAATSFSDVGYAVGFETSRQGVDDRFADYILIEVLPGEDSGAFATDEKSSRSLKIGGSVIPYQELFVNSDQDPNIDVDLLIYQREVKELGYTLGFYAIGEPSNRQTLFDAFQIMLRTYRQQHDPFSFS